MLSVYGLTVGGRQSHTRSGSNLGVEAVSLCRPSQLSASSYWNGAVGRLINFFTVANRSGTACSLPLEGPVVLLTWHHSSLSVREKAAAFKAFSSGKPLRILAPGRKAAILMQWSNWCGRPQNGLTATVTLRFSDGLRVAAQHVVGEPPCMDRTYPSVLSISRPMEPS